MKHGPTGESGVKRIVYTIATGSPKFAKCALGLGRSLKLIGDQTRRVVITDQTDHPWDRSFDEVLKPDCPFEWTLFSKFSALERTDADQVLFIDCDSLAFKRLDPIFEYCAGRGLCVQGRIIRGGTWYGSVEGHLKKHGVEFMPQFNGGMVYYERTPACQETIQRVYSEGLGFKDAGFIYDRSLIPEEPYLSLAMAKGGLDSEARSHVIPDHFDFLGTATGLIDKLELDVMSNRCQFVGLKYDLRLVKPFIFHASRYINFAAYWRQLDKLRWLEEYESKHGFGYMSPLHRLDRSIQRRYLKYIKRVF